MTSRPPTIHDIAAAANVSPSTVSRALRDHPRISLARREAIQALAREMGYRPDPLISALLSRRYQRKGSDISVIAYITTYTARDGWKYGALKRFYEGACHQAEQQGFRVEVFWLREPKMTPRRLSDILRARGIQGVLIAPLERGYGHINLQWQHFSSAAIGYSMIRPSLHRSTPHHFHNMLLALRSLRKKGHQRICLILSSVTNQKVGENFLAAALTFRHHYGEDSITVEVLQPFQEGMTTMEQHEVSRQRMRRLCTQWEAEGMPDCIFAPGALAVARSIFPPGIDLIFHGPLDNAAIIPPYMDEKPRQVGAAAVDLVIRQIQRHETGLPTVPKIVMVEGSWTEMLED